MQYYLWATSGFRVSRFPDLNWDGTEEYLLKRANEAQKLTEDGIWGQTSPNNRLLLASQSFRKPGTGSKL